MPETYATWADGLGSADVAYALLGLGLIPSRLHRKAASAIAEVAAVLARDEVHAWRFDARPTAEQWTRLPSARTLAMLVKGAAANSTQRFSLLPGSPLSTVEVWNRVRREIPVTQVAAHVACAPSHWRVRLRWPLRIGFLPGEVGDHWMDDLKAADYWGGNVYETFVMSRRASECDLLVCVDGALDAQSEIARARAGLGDVRADLVAVFAPPALASGQVLTTLDATRAAAHAAGLALFELGTATPITQIRDFCIELSHNHPIDVALARATSGTALLMASRQLLEASGLLLKASNLATALGSRSQAKITVDVGKFGRWAAAAAPEPELVGVGAEPGAGQGTGRGIGYAACPPRRSTPRPSPPPPPPEAVPETAKPAKQRAKPLEPTRADMGRFLRRAARTFPWQHESSDASELGSVLRRFADEDEDAAGVRYLQAAFASEKRPDEPLATALKAASRYFVNVFVGPARKGFARGDVAFPDLPPPDDGRAHELDVVFWEPALCRKPVVQKIDLPPLGASEMCRFPLRTLRTTKAINARISILHRNRVLQTGTLKAPVGRKGEVLFELDAIPRRVLSGLDERTNFSMALVLNDTDGEGAVHLMAKGKAQTFKAGDPAIGDLVNAIGAAISDITNDPANYQGLKSPGSEALLRKLAVKGSILREYLERYSVDGGKLVTPEYVQLVSTKPGKVFPLEFIYDWKKPKLGATLCAHAEAALAAGDCLPTCARHADPAAMGNTVCPFGFWGLRCVIERKLNDNRQSAGGKRDPASNEPVKGSRRVLKPLSSVIVGATPKANAVVATSVADMLTRIRKLDAKAPQVSQWAKWPEEIAKAKPATLALVVHQDVDGGGTPEIEIGPPPLLSSDDLDDEYVCAPDSAAPPLVLLIGCETGKADISYENFALRFQWRGAALVVSTIAEVVGRQAAPMAADILEAISQVKKPTSFAVVMRDVRRNLLAQGTPMVLGLVADGDADWDIVGN